LVDTPNPLVGSEPAVDVDATDSGSGVTDAQLLVDGEMADDLPQDCPDGGCELIEGFLPELSDYGSGQHSFEIVASDAAGNAVHQSGTFHLDPTAPTLTVTGPLAEYDQRLLPTETADATIQATDNTPGDSGLVKIEVSVDDAIDATDDLSCNPGCVGSASTTYTYAKSDWAPGPHVVTVTATDKAGNVSQKVVDVDVPTPASPVQCPDVTATVGDPGNVVTVSEAQSSVMASALAPSQPTSDTESAGGALIDPSLSQPTDAPPASLTSTQTLSDDQIASTPPGGVNVDGAICLVPTQTTTAETTATVVNGDAALRANTAPDTDTVTRPTAAGEALIESLRGPGAPQSFSWKVSIPEGNQLVQLSDGGIAVVDPSLTPEDTDVPDAPTDGQNPAAIPDAAVQLAAADHEVAYAGQETGKWVDAVIPPPYKVEAQGDTHSATLTLTDSNTITVDASNARTLYMALYNSKREFFKADYCTPDVCWHEYFRGSIHPHDIYIEPGNQQKSLNRMCGPKVHHQKCHDGLIGIYYHHKGNDYAHANGYGYVQGANRRAWTVPHEGYYRAIADCWNRSDSYTFKAQCQWGKGQH
jgi:hypothetical protein